jgi:REP element-mobilizing transposase RayT
VDWVDDLREVVRAVRQMHPFEIVAWVLLPEHLHAVWARVMLPHESAAHEQETV